MKQTHHHDIQKRNKIGVTLQKLIAIYQGIESKGIHKNKKRSTYYAAG